MNETKETMHDVEPVLNKPYTSMLAKTNQLIVGAAYRLLVKMMAIKAQPTATVKANMASYLSDEGFKIAMDELETLTINKPEYETIYKPVKEIMDSVTQAGVFDDTNENLIKVAVTLAWIDLKVKSGYWPKNIEVMTTDGQIFNAIVEELTSLITTPNQLTENSLVCINATYTNESNKKQYADLIVDDMLYAITTTQDYKGSYKKNREKAYDLLASMPNELKEFGITCVCYVYPRFGVEDIYYAYELEDLN